MARKTFFGEFKEFINRGNVIDLAVGVIIGGAFQGIIKSLVEDVVMPAVSLITGGVDFSAWKIVVGTGADAASINYGNLLTNVINFLLMALVVFCFVKALNKLKRPHEEPKKPEVLTKKCPYCLMEVPKGAVRCGYCTSALEAVKGENGSGKISEKISESEKEKRE